MLRHRYLSQHSTKINGYFSNWDCDDHEPSGVSISPKMAIMGCLEHLICNTFLPNDLSTRFCVQTYSQTGMNIFPKLQSHPFPVEAFFKQSVVVTCAVEKSILEKLIPSPLTLDTFQNHWGFVAMALVETQNLRPKGFPNFLGNDFTLVGYRIFVRYTNSKGKNLRGLYILKSETDKRKMEFLGNIFTNYQYKTIDIQKTTQSDSVLFQSKSGGFQMRFETTLESDIGLPTSSPFTDWKEARRFAGPLPFTFSVNNMRKEVVIVEGKREIWQPKPIQILKFSSDYINQVTNSQFRLASGFVVENIPYEWKSGKIEPL